MNGSLAGSESGSRVEFPGRPGFLPRSDPLGSGCRLMVSLKLQSSIVAAQGLTRTCMVREDSYRFGAMKGTQCYSAAVRGAWRSRLLALARRLLLAWRLMTTMCGAPTGVLRGKYLLAHQFEASAVKLRSRNNVALGVVSDNTERQSCEWRLVEIDAASDERVMAQFERFEATGPGNSYPHNVQFRKDRAAHGRRYPIARLT